MASISRTATSPAIARALPLFRLHPPTHSRLIFRGSQSYRETLARSYSTAPPSPPPGFLRRTRTVARYTFYLVGSTIVGCGLLTAGIFVHDAFTYQDRVSVFVHLLPRAYTDSLVACQHVKDVPVAPRALQPERGGPKNLPVLSTLLSDWEDEENRGLSEKPHLVIVGGGWGVRPSVVCISILCYSPSHKAVGVLDKLSPGDYHVTIISPETYTTFTPLLPCMCQHSSRSHCITEYTVL